MAEWGKYLKNAVANVEQQLDKVLLEQQNQPSVSQSGASSSQSDSQSKGNNRPGRTDLAERLRKAANGRTTQKNSGNVDNKEQKTEQKTDEPAASASVDQSGLPTSERVSHSGDISQSEGENNRENNRALQGEPDLLVHSAYVSAPDLTLLLTNSRKLALQVHRDEALELVDQLDSTQLELNAYIENMSDRLKSAYSKIDVLSRNRSETTSGLEQQVSLLMNEGMRLSKRELELNLIIKRLRAEKAASIAKTSEVPAKDAEIAQLKAQLESKNLKLRESEALTEHFRGLAEANAMGSLPVDSEVDGTPSNNNISSNTKRANQLQRQFAEEKEKWHIVEAGLLSRIAELEQSVDVRANTTEHLQKSIKEAQHIARSARDEVSIIRNELDSSKKDRMAVETRLNARIIELEMERDELKNLLKEKNSNSHNDTPEFCSPDQEPYEKFTLNDSNPKQGSDKTEEVNESIPSPTSEPLMDPSDLYAQSQSALSQLDQDAVGPAGPFGVLADTFEPDYPPTDISTSAMDLHDATDDSFSFLNQSRRESSMQGSELIQGSQVHLVRKLTLSVQRLENELSSALKLTEIANQQRDEAQAGLVELVDAQEQLQQLTDTHIKLEAAHQEILELVESLKKSILEKDERIEELDADFRDLKEMYKEQIETLITEIEALKQKGVQ